MSYLNTEDDDNIDESVEETTIFDSANTNSSEITINIIDQCEELWNKKYEEYSKYKSTMRIFINDLMDKIAKNISERSTFLFMTVPEFINIYDLYIIKSFLEKKAILVNIDIMKRIMYLNIDYTLRDKPLSDVLSAPFWKRTGFYGKLKRTKTEALLNKIKSSIDKYLKFTKKKTITMPIPPPKKQKKFTICPIE